MSLQSQKLAAIFALCFVFTSAGASYCPKTIEDAAKLFQVSTSLGPQDNRQLGVTLAVQQQIACLIRDAGRDGNCATGSKQIFLTMPETNQKPDLTQAQVVSNDNDNHFIFGVEKSHPGGFYTFASYFFTKPQVRRSNSWKSGKSIEKDIPSSFRGAYIPVDILDSGETVVTVKSSLGYHIRNYGQPYPNDQSIESPTLGFYVHVVTSKGRLLASHLRFGESTETWRGLEGPVFELDTEWKVLPRGNWSNLIEPLGGNDLLALTDEGVLYYIQDETLTKLSSVPGEAVAMTGYALPLDPYEKSPAAPQRAKIGVWVAARDTENSAVKLYELTGQGKALTLTDYQVPEQETLTSISVDVKPANELKTRGDLAIPGLDYFRVNAALPKSKTRDTKMSKTAHYFKLVVGTVEDTQQTNHRFTYRVRALAPNSKFQEIPWWTPPKVRTKAKAQPASVVDERYIREFDLDVRPDLNRYYSALSREFLDAQKSMSEEQSLYYYGVRWLPASALNALYRRIALTSVYHKPATTLLGGVWGSEFTPEVRTLALELATLAPQRISTAYVPFFYFAEQPLSADWKLLLAEKLKDAFSLCQVDDSGEMVGHPLTHDVQKGQCKIVVNAAWKNITERAAHLYQEDAGIFSHFLTNMLFQLMEREPNLQVGEALVRVLNIYDPLRAYSNMRQIETQVERGEPSSNPVTDLLDQ